MNRTTIFRPVFCLGAFAISALLWPGSARATTYTYSISSGNGDVWSSGTHWDDGSASTSNDAPVSASDTILVFQPAGGTGIFSSSPLANINANNLGEFSLSQLTLGGTGSNLIGNPISTIITGDSLKFSTNGQINFDASNGTGTSTVAYNVNPNIVTTGALTLTGNGTAAFTLGGGISGAGSLVKTGGSTVTLSGHNTYAGGTTFSSGTLNINSSTALGATASTFTITGGTIDNTSVSAKTLVTNNAIILGGDFAFTGTNDLNLGSGAITATAVRTVTVNAGNLTLGGGISGSGGITKAGAGTLILNGNNTYTGTTSVYGGSLVVNGRLGSVSSYGGAITIGNYFTPESNITFNSAFDQTLTGSISGSGSLTKSGAGALYLAGTNNYFGNVFINGGELAVTGSLSSAVANEGTFTYTSYYNSLLGKMSGSGTLKKSNPGTLSISDADAYTGNINIDGGGLVFYSRLASGYHTGTIATGSAVNTGSTIIFNSSSDQILTGAISESGTLTKNGSGTLTLNNASNYTGNITIGGGGLVVNGPLAQGSYGGTISTGGTYNGGSSFTINSSSDQNFYGTISGYGGLTKGGSGKLSLLGTINYYGDTIINGGELSVNGPLIVGTGSYTSTIYNQGAFSFTSSNNSNQVIAKMTGSGSLRKDGNGMLFINDTDAYTGDITIASGGLTLGSLLASGNYTGTINNVKNNSVGSSITFNSSSDQTIGGLIGGGALIKNGTGTLTIGGSAIYSNNITVAGGGGLVLNGLLASSEKTISITNSYEKESSITFNASSDQAITTISGSGSLIKNGSGDLTLYAANSFVGKIFINNGKISVIGSLGGGHSSTIVNEGTLDLYTTSNQFIENLSGSGSLVSHGYNSTVYLSGTDAFNGNITISGTGLVVNDRLASGYYTGTIVDQGILTFASAFDQTLAGVISGSGSSFNDPLTKAGTGILTLTANNTYSGAILITGGLVNFSSLGNLGTGKVTLNGGGLQWATGNTADISSRLNGTIGSAGGTFDTTGNNVTISTNLSGGSNRGPLIKAGAGILTLTGNNTYASDTTITGGLVNFSSLGNLGTGFIRLNGGGLQWAPGNTTDLASRLSNVFGSGGGTLDTNGNNVTLSTSLYNVGSSSGALTKTGAGTLTLTGDNYLNAGLIVSEGTLAAGTASALGTTGTITVNAAGMLDVSSFGLNDLRRLSGTGTVTGTGVYSYSTAADDTVANRLSGTGSLSKTGTNTLTLTGANTYTGGSTISAGTLQIGDGGTTGGIVGNISNSGVLVFNRSDAATFSGILSGTGSLTKSGTGTLTLSGTNTYSGGTAITGGLVNFSTLGNFGTGNITLDGGGLQWAAGTTTNISSRLNAIGAGGATFDTNGNNVSLSANLSGEALTKTGVGTLTLTGANTYTGGTAITGGLVNFSSVGNFGTGNITLDGGGVQWATGTTTNISSRLNAIGAGGATFDTNGNNVSLSANLSGGALTKTGTGTLTLSGTNTYTGGTTISAGTLQIGTGGSIAGDVTNNGTLAFSSTAVTSYTGVISGSGSLNKLFGGRLTLGSANTYGGATTITGIADGTVNLLVSSLANGGQTSSIGSSGSAASNLIFAGGMLGYNGSGQSTDRLFQVGTDATFNSAGLSSTGAGAINFTNTGALTYGTASRNTLFLAGTNTGANTLAALIADSGVGTTSVSKSGTGNWTLNGNNSYTAGTIISGGKITMGNANAIGTTGTINITSGTLDASTYGIGNIGRLAGTGTVTTSGVYVYSAAADDSVANKLTGTGSLSKSGANTLALTGANTYSGGTTLQSGVLSVGNNQGLGTGKVTVSGGTLLVQKGFSISNQVQLSGGTLSKELAGNGSLIHAADASSGTVGVGTGTRAEILAGTLSGAAGGTAALASSFSSTPTSAASNDNIRISDVYHFSGTGNDVFVLQLTVAGVDSDGYLGWLNGGAWVNAIEGNTGNNATAAMQGFNGTYAQFVALYSSFTLSQTLGAYGRDANGDTVWAVINHNSDFTAVPEPGTWVLLVAGMMMVGWAARRKC